MECLQNFVFENNHCFLHMFEFEQVYYYCFQYFFFFKNKYFKKKKKNSQLFNCLKINKQN